MNIKRCEQCDNLFDTGYHKHKKYCSDACRQSAYRRRLNPAIDHPDHEKAIRDKQVQTKHDTTKELWCVVCGRHMVVPVSQTNLMYCSDACKQKMYRERRKLAKS